MSTRRETLKCLGKWGFWGSLAGSMVASHAAAPGRPPLVYPPVRISAAQLRVGISESVTGRLDRSARQLAMRLLQRHLEETTGWSVSMTPSVPRRELRSAAQGGRFDIFVLGGGDFPLCGGPEVLRAHAMAAGMRGRPERCVLVAPLSKSLLQLADGRVALGSLCPDDEPSRWALHLLAAHGMAAPQRFFRMQEELASARLPVLRTFFAKADACVVREDDFSTVCRENPAVGERLTALHASPALPQMLLAVGPRRDGEEPLARALDTWATSPRGRAFARLLGHPKWLPVDTDAMQALLAIYSPAGTAARGAHPDSAEK